MNRKIRIQKRKQIPDRHQKDLQIAIRLLPFFHHQSSIGLYIPVRGEADGFELLVRTLVDPAFTSQDAQKRMEKAGSKLSLEQLALLNDLKKNPPCLFAPKVISKTEMEMYPLVLKQVQEHNNETENHRNFKKKAPSQKTTALDERSTKTAPWALELEDELLLEAGGFGLLEPAVKTYGLKASVPDLLIIPLLAFDQGDRLGYGGGYYDRYLAKHPECIRIGIAYDEQEEPLVPNPWDEKLDVIITPTRELHFPRKAAHPKSVQADKEEEK